MIGGKIISEQEDPSINITAQAEDKTKRERWSDDNDSNWSKDIVSRRLQY